VGTGSIDGGRIRQKTKRVALSPEERSRVGRLLQDLRDDRELKQANIAETIGCSVGTVQAIEYNKWKVDRDTIEKYAAVFGTTVHGLLHPDARVQPSDPEVADLNREHLAIARGYMRAVKAVRTAVEVLLADQSRDRALADRIEDIAELVVALKPAVDRHPSLAYDLGEALTRGDVLVELADRLERDPMFEERLRDLLDEPTPAIPPTDSAPRTKRK